MLRRQKLTEHRKHMHTAKEPIGTSLSDSVSKVDPAVAHKLSEQNEVLRETVARQRSEFDNFRRRVQKEKDAIRDEAVEGVIADILPVIDNFDRAIASSREASDCGSIRKGVEMIEAQLSQILAGHGLQRIDAKGSPFDPHQHEALAVEETPHVPENTVVDVMLPGYLLKERVIRPAVVKVAKPPQGSRS